MPVFFFTDIEGSTRLWEEHTGAMGAVIARHDALLKEAIEAAGGRITKHTGDGVTAAFAGGQPLAGALEVQRRFASEPWGAIGELRIRVGLHAGEAEWIAGPMPERAAHQHTGDYFGPPVNATARVMSAAWGGQILLTPQVTQASALPDRATLLDLGLHLLKNVSAPQQLYQLEHPDLPWHEFPPPRTLSGQSIRQAVDRQGAEWAELAPPEMAVSLVSATLLPAVLGDVSPGSPALVGNVGVLEDLGAGVLAEFLAWFAAHLREGEPEEIRQELERALQQRWAADAGLRSDASLLLQAVQGVEAAMTAASAEVKEVLARGLASLGEQFGEFRWMLGDVQETLAEMRERQAQHLALEREHLALTEEILHLQREQVRGPVISYLPETEEVPAFVKGEERPFEPPVFVARQGELARLERFLLEAQAGNGRVIFVTGGVGRGKTALLSEFARRAMVGRPDLLVASGSCNAYSGSGDPYLPFRELMGMLSGEVEARWASGLVSGEHARRLWGAIPTVAQALLRRGPNAIGVLVDGSALLARSTTASGGEATWLEPLRQTVERQRGAATAGPGGLEQSHLFEQCTNVLRTVSETYPLLLVLDDLQWADPASIDLLFHLGRRLAGSRVLIAGAYRPEEVALDREGVRDARAGERHPRVQDRHPLEKAVGELKRQFGDIAVDLGRADRAEGQGFVEAFLATEPNQLGDEFRQGLFRHTEGHPLFTVELLRAMQERGDLVRDDAGRWVEGPSLSWEALPARVEAVIEERIGRLGEELRETLSVASVEGEEFTAQVVAQVQHLQERRLLRALSQELVKRHRLVQEGGEDRVGRRLLSRYRFAHSLFQRYLYNDLSAGERRLLHGEIAEVLEELFQPDTEPVAVQLAYHYCQAGAKEKAVPYLIQAGHRARVGFAHGEAIRYYSEALEILTEDEAPPSSGLAAVRFDLLAARASVYDITAQRPEQKADAEAMLALAQQLGDEARRCDALLALADYYLETGVVGAVSPAQEALVIAESLGDAVRQAQALRRLGDRHWYQGEYQLSRARLEAAIERFVEAGLTADAAGCLHMLSLALGGAKETGPALEAAQRSVALSREAGDRRQEAIGLRRMAIALMDQGQYVEALRHAEGALMLHRELGDRGEECNALNVLGILHAELGEFEESERALRSSLEIAESIASSVAVLYAMANLGRNHYLRQGELQTYVALFDEQVRNAAAREDEWLAASLLQLQGFTLELLGQYWAAQTTLEPTLQTFERLGRSGGFPYDAWCNLAMVQVRQGAYVEARRNLSVAADNARETGDGDLLGAALFEEALIAWLEGDGELIEAGLGLVEAGVAAWAEGGRFVKAVGYDVGARLHLALGRIAEAAAFSRKAVDLVEADPGPWRPHEAFFTHSQVLRALGREAEADEYLRRAYDRVMLVAGKTTDPELKQSWLENVQTNRQILAACAERGIGG